MLVTTVCCFEVVQEQNNLKCFFTSFMYRVSLSSSLSGTIILYGWVDRKDSIHVVSCNGCHDK